MNPWLVWAVFVIAAVLLGFVGYHFAVRTLRFFTLFLALAVIFFVTRYGITHPAGPSASPVSSFSRGFDDLSAAFFRPLLGRNISAPGRIGWLAIIVGLVFGYRELEVWSMRWQPPTVDISALSGGQQATQTSDAPDEPDEGRTDKQRHDRLVAELRFRLPAVEVRAPAVLPGGTKPNELASIAENSGVNGSGLAGAIIRFFSMLWPNPRRYRVRVWIEHDERSAHDEKRASASTRVTVDLESLKSGGSIATKTLVAREFDQAASAVAGYVARHIFKEDPTAPPWCVGSVDGDDLAAMLIVGQQRVSPRSPHDIRHSRRKQIDILEKCKLDASVARYELAQLYDLEGQHVKALLLHAMNREDYPRFYRGRYRLGMSLEMIANPVFKLSDRHAMDMLESLHVLDRCDVTHAPAGGRDIVPGPLPSGLRAELLAAAQDELRAVRQQLTLWRVIWEMLWHRDERAIRKPYWRMRERQRFHDGARVAELLVAVRQSLVAAELHSDLNGSPHADSPSHKASRQAGAMRIAAAITGDSAAIKARLENSAPPGVPKSPGRKRSKENAKKTRFLPLLRRTPSWQAAYNTACVYAALGQPCHDWTKKEEMAEQVVISLTRAFNDPDCEMERPWDWISADPDFSSLQSSKKFQSFLDGQNQRDYPADHKACIFCHGTDADIEITREYTFSKWVSEVLPPAGVKPHISCKRSAIFASRPSKTWHATEAVGHARRVVCMSCEATWIAKLERAVQPLLTPMIKGHDVELTPQEQITVATWAVLKAAAFECAWTGDPVLTGPDRGMIKTHSRPPASLQVRLAVLQPDRNLLRAVGHVYEFRQPGDQVLCLTITIGCLVAQVFGGSGAETRGLGIADLPDTDIVRIYPPQAGTVSWPLPNPLDEKRLLTLANPLAFVTVPQIPHAKWVAP